MNDHYDVIIIGAGIVGLALAKALSSLPLRIGLFDQNSEPDTVFDSQHYDPRVSAITPASQQFLEALTVWPEIVAYRASPFTKIEVWDASGQGHLTFSSQEVDAPCLGHIVENRCIVGALWKSLQGAQERENVSAYFNAELQECRREGNQWQLITSAQTVSATLLVGADGGSSWVRGQAGITLKQWEYGHHALVATVKMEYPHEKTARQRFLSQGPLAFLPLVDEASCDQWYSIVWSTSPEEAHRLAHCSLTDFQHELAHGFEGRLGSVLEVNNRHVFPLRMRHADHYVQAGLALVGDAAHTVHPLAGQGVNLGLMDVATLYDVIKDALDQQKDFSHFFTLRRYERWRKGENLAMLAMVEILKRLFAIEWSPMASVRTWGLNRVGQTKLVKQRIILQAMGLTDNLPSLARSSHKELYSSEMKLRGF